MQILNKNLQLIYSLINLIIQELNLVAYINNYKASFSEDTYYKQKKPSHTQIT